MIFDYTNEKNETAVRKQARLDLAKLFEEFLVEKFGRDNVKYVDKNTLGFIFGFVNDNDGCPCDVVATVKPVIKNYQDHIGEKRATMAFDFFQAAEDYEMGISGAE